MPKVDPARVKDLMDRLNFSAKDLARRTGLSVRTVARCRSGKDPVRPRVVAALAKALDVLPGVLTDALPMPDARRGPEKPSHASSERLSVDVTSDIRNAFSLVALRYSVPYTRIVELAPTLFDYVARRSLRERREAVAAVEDASQRLDGLRDRVPHLPRLATRPHNAHDEALIAERDSIAAQDVFGARVTQGDHLDDYWLDDEDELPNPFVATLKRMAEEAGQEVEINTVDNSWVWYDNLCRDDAVALACNDAEIADALLRGAILIKDIPRELFAEDKSEERLAWLRERYDALPKYNPDELPF